MAKTRFERPILPKDATEEERRKAMFDALYSLDLSDKLERRENDKLSYLSWANAWAEFKRAYPNADNQPALFQRPEHRNHGLYRGYCGWANLRNVAACNGCKEQGYEGTAIHLPSL